MKFSFIYGLLVFLRIFLHVNIQNGYIHPDEFFQTIEISAGDVLNFKIMPPWEFDSKFPIRSKAIIEIFINVPLRAYLELRELFSNFKYLPFDLLTFCRFWTSICSIIVDYFIYKMCLMVNANFKLALLLHGFSHISVVYLSRSFTNVWETQLLSLFGIFIIKKRNFTNQVAQGIIIAIGVFCRPTFPIFVFPYIVISIIPFDFIVVSKYAINGLIGFLSTAIVLISFDTAKYASEHGVYSFSDYIITPINFINYNRNVDNLLHHGYHPWFVHLLVNLPMMLGILALLTLFAPLLCGFRKSISKLWLCAMTPLVMLSIFPHQEMRFLLPVYPVSIVIVSLMFTIKKSHRFTKFILLSHLVFSLLSILFWGYLHQAGVMEAARLIQRSMTGGDLCRHSIIAYKSFLMPQFPFSIPIGRNCNWSIHNLVGLDESQFWNRSIKLRQELVPKSVLHLIFPKAFRFENPENFKDFGLLKSVYTISGHINTDLLSFNISLLDFMSLQYMKFSV